MVRTGKSRCERYHHDTKRVFGCLKVKEYGLSLAMKEMPMKPSNYREQALKLFPWVCGHCGREFEGKQLKELTVHHKNHNHDDNPPDGSNWELLCIYCHDHEHSKYEDAHLLSGPERKEHQGTHNPFAGLDKLLKTGDDD